jgi:hypothetical protein
VIAACRGTIVAGGLPYLGKHLPGELDAPLRKIAQLLGGNHEWAQFAVLGACADIKTAQICRTRNGKPANGSAM